jgi:imidazolonepropionase-like amidohydrolase
VGGKREGRFRVLALDVENGGEEVLASASWRYWLPRPHFSADGGELYYTDDSTGSPLLYRLPLEEQAEAEPVTQPLDQFREGLVSPDGKQLAYRRNSEIWVVPLTSGTPAADDARRLSAEGGASFAFTPDGSAVIYAAGNRVYRRPLAGRAPEEIPVQLALDVAEPIPVLVKRVRVLDFPQGGFGPETSVFVRGGRIEWIGSEDGRRIPSETTVLDAVGGFAIPGLFDMHVHVESSWEASDVAQEAFIAYGVTSVRDTGESFPWVKALADRSKTDQAVPRYFYPGDAFESSQPGRGGWGLGIQTVDEGREYVRRWKRRGAHFIKTHPPISWSVRRAVVDEARRLKLPVAGHGAIIEELTQSVIWGHAFIEHAGGPGGRVYDDVLQLLAMAGTRWDPTLMNMGVGLVWAREEPERWDDPKLSAFVPEEVRRIVKSAWGGVDAKALRGLWFEQLAQIREANRYGVRLHVGTDAQFWQMVYPGSSLHMEMELFAQAGLTPLEVLRLTTIEAATALGVQDDLGTLEAGKLADIVLLDANPLEDIKNTQAIQLVIKDGRVFDPEELKPGDGTGNE